MLPVPIRRGGVSHPVVPDSIRPAHSAVPRPRRGGRSALAAVTSILGVAALAAPAAADLGLHVAAGPDGIRPGELIDLEVTISNDTSGLRTGVLVEIDVPAGMASIFESEIDGDCPSSTCDPGETVSFTIDLLPPGASRTLRYPFGVAGSAAPGTVLEFPVRLFDDGAPEGTASASITVDPNRELELAITENRDPVAPGQRMEYSIGWGLRTTSPGSPGTTLEFPVPAGMSVVEVSGNGTVVGDLVSWSLGSLAPGDSGEQRVLVAVDGGTDVGTILATTATLANAFGQSVQASAATPVSTTPPLDVRLTASPDPARPGELLDLEITVTNRGAFELFDVRTRLDFPDAISSFFEVDWDLDCPSSTCDPRERGVITIGDLAAGASRTYSLPLELAGSAGSGRVIRFDADVLDSFGYQASSSGLVRVADDRGLELLLSEDRDPATSGESITWTLAWGNRTTAAGAFGGRLELPVPPGTSFAGATGGGTLAGDTVVWELGVLAPGTIGEERATFTVDALPAGSIVDARARLAADDTAPVAAETATRVAGDLPLELTVVASPDPAEADEFLDVVVTVTNRGSQPRFGVAVRLDLPDEVASFFESTFDGDCPSSTCDPRERVALLAGVLDPGEGRTWLVPIRIGGGIEGGRVVPFEAEVSDDTGAIREAAATLLVAADRTAGLSLVASDEPVVPGDEVTWTLTWASRIGGDGAAAATASVRLPEAVTFVAATDGGTLDGDVVRWDLGGVSPGAGGERRVRGVVDAAPDAGTILVAEAWFDEGDAEAGSLVRFGETTRTDVVVPLDVEITAQRQPVAPGADLPIRVSVRNAGRTVREGVVLRMGYTAGLASIFDSGFEGDCPSSTCDPGEVVSFDVGSLAAGAEVSFTVPAVVANAAAVGTVINLDAEAFDVTGVRGHDGDAVVVGSSFRIANPGDLDNNGVVDIFDVLGLLAGWGACPDADACPQDFSGDGVIGINDLLVVLSNYD
jgi:hypothetical protein